MDRLEVHHTQKSCPFTDTKTGLSNAVIFRDRLQQAVSYAKRYGNTLAVMIVHIDDLNLVNTAMGRTVGDVLLCTLADRISNDVRKSDAVARLDQDSFAILLPNLREAIDAARVAEKLLATLSMPVQLTDREVCVTGATGIAVYPADGPDAETLISHAASAAQEVGRTGQGGFRFFEPDLALRAAERLEIEADLRRAAAEREFVLHYQPVVDMSTGEVVSAEALIRWNHPNRGLLPPSAFISIAESTGLIVSIGEWAISEACRDARGWQQIGYPPVRLSVNVSMRQLQKDNFVETLMQWLVATSFDSALLQIELTESLFVHDHRYVRGVLERLRDLGVGVAIDDFGTGFSSLRQLMELPIDTLKIDRSFVSGIPESHDALVIVETMAQLGRNLSLTVVAEGVEGSEQFEFLSEIGCHQCQGYLFSKPLPAAEFSDYLDGHRQQCSTLDDQGAMGHEYRGR